MAKRPWWSTNGKRGYALALGILCLVLAAAGWVGVFHSPRWHDWLMAAGWSPVAVFYLSAWWIRRKHERQGGQTTSLS
ncbi:hypothetical protein [Kineococcus terrestris]|uniref:hypothetical protein n=1 Tax=Kineococcus terrestris TaxID=2044856 RepID=UPI0034DB2281